MKRDPKETRRRIIQAAGDLFYGKGIRTVSVDAVAERAGVTKRTLYYHFKSKDELIAAYLESRNNPTLAWLTSALVQSKGTLADQIEGLFTALVQWGKSPESKGCPFARAAAELAGTPDHPALKVVSRHKAELEQRIKERISAAGLDEPALLARQIMVLVDGAITEMLIHGDAIYADAAREAARTLIGARSAKYGESS